jgi:hypothetical protein
LSSSFVMALVLVGQAEAEDVQFLAPLTGTDLATPTNVGVSGVLDDRVAGHTYRVAVTLPDGTVAVTPVNAMGQWSLPPVPLSTVANDALHTFVAEAYDVTGVQRLVDRDMVHVLDRTPFAATMTDRRSSRPGAYLVRVPPSGIARMNPAYPAVADALGTPFDDAIAQAFAQPQNLATEGECWFALDLAQQEWDELVVLILAALSPEVAPVVAGLQDLLERVEICSSGVTPELQQVTMGDVNVTLEPVLGALEGPASLGAVYADIELETALTVSVDLTDIVEVGLVLELDLEDLHVCDASYDATGVSRESSLAVAAGSSGRTIDLTEPGSGTVTFDGAVYDASGVCGWGIFDDLLQRSRDNVEHAMARGLEQALGGSDDLVAKTVDFAWSDVETSIVSPIRHLSTFTTVQTLQETGLSPEPGGFLFVASTVADGDGTQASSSSSIYTQASALPSLGARTPGGVPFDLAAGLSTAALNQVLSAGADSALMTFQAQPTWDDLGLCAAAPAGASCEDAAPLDSATLQHIHPGFAAIGAATLQLEYEATLAPFVAMELDPPGPEPEGFFFLGGYTVRLVEPAATPRVWLEYTCGAEGSFTMGLGDLDGGYTYGLPLAGCLLTTFDLGAWPDETVLEGRAGPLFADVMAQSTASIEALPAPEPTAALTALTELEQRRQDAMFLVFAALP